jgi:4-amino-4-deoxy-L-arabinose transferase-like glycosyltransferase
MRDHKFVVKNGSEGWLRDLLLLIVVLGIPFFQYLGGLPLMDPDEGRYAEIPREMLERGDLITPTLNYVKYFEKPPLLYWINAASLKLFGQNEFAARFPSALCGLLTVLVTYIIARKLYGRRAALISAVILGTSAGFVLQSRIILTDMLLTFCLTSALGAFIVAAQREGRRSRALPWYLFYLFCALATLAKGLIGMVFPAGIIFFYLLLSRRWRLLAEMRLIPGLLLFLAVAAPWFVVVSLRNPEFAHFFFIHEHFQRFTSTVHDRYQPFWFFVPVLFGTMLPWSFFIPGALGSAWRDRHHEDGRAGMYLLIWIVLIFLFFSKSSSKLIPYILPVFPPLSMLIAHRLSLIVDGRAREIKTAAFMLGVTLCLIAAGASAYGFLPDLPSGLLQVFPKYAKKIYSFQEHLPTVSTVTCLVIAGLTATQGLACLVFAGRSPVRLIATLSVLSLVLTVVIERQIMPAIAAGESTRILAGEVNKMLTPQTRIVTWGPMQSLNWYIGRRTATYYTFDELDFGRRQGDQTGWFFDKLLLKNAWSSDQLYLFVVARDTFENLQILFPLPHTRIVGSSGRYLLVSNK